MAKEEVRARQDVVGTTVGLITFLVGVCLLAFVFMLAMRLFNDTGILTAMAATPPGADAAKEGPGLAGTFAALGVKVVSLFVMVLAGSLFSSKGIHLYLASR
ncbi:MAG: hypothetical protein GX774_09640 [Armatimonadetes bacterium]|nr:hypothetical protein [Armatimonadota bacterium]